MMMIMVYALHDEKEEREILKKIKILFILIKGTIVQCYFIICVTASINISRISINNILLISFKGNVRMSFKHKCSNIQLMYCIPGIIYIFSIK